MCVPKYHYDVLSYETEVYCLSKMITLLVVFFHKVPNIDCYKISEGFRVSPEGFGVSK
jgi:hypothetical protein